MANFRGNNSHHIRVLGISGSLREGSFNTALLRAAQKLAPEGMKITLLDLQDIPLYNGDVEAEGDPQSVAALKAAIRDADGVLFATPEYNYGTSGVLKNAIDWASRDRREGSLAGKPVAVMGAGGMAGTARAQLQLHNTLAETGALVMAKPGVLVAYAWERFDSEGRLVDRATAEAVRQHLEELSKWITRVGTRRPALAAA